MELFNIAFKSFSDSYVDAKSILLQLAKKENFTNNTSMQKYLDRCTEYCWIMAIQDPPMMLDFSPAQNEEFDKDIFRCYTRNGENVEFVVWPAVFLYKDGPLVTKGVLQPIAK